MTTNGKVTLTLAALVALAATQGSEVRGDEAVPSGIGQPPPPPPGKYPPESVSGVMVPIPATQKFRGALQYRSINAFAIDQTEVTVKAYQQCVIASGCTVPAGRAHLGSAWVRPDRVSHPVTDVTWDQAKAFCSWAGKRLPLSLEWEYAGGDTVRQAYPWGATMNPAALCWSGPGNTVRASGITAETCPVDTYRSDARVWGSAAVIGLAGNAAEWVDGTYHEGPHTYKKGQPPAPPYDGHTHRGGSGLTTVAVEASITWSSGRAPIHPEHSFADVGFRCARTLTK